MALLDTTTGGASGQATADELAGLQALQAISAPTVQGLDLPALEQYALAQNMTPAQMQAFLQQNNALASENVDQTGTGAEQAALAQLANTANQGAAGNATEQAQQAQIQQDMGRTLAGQRGAIDQQAEARGVPPGLLQAALAQQEAGQGAQSANQAALQAQSQNYQTALNALANQGQLGGQLQGQQNTQANTIAQAQNAMQQFNAANQQNAAAANTGYKQAANAQNTQAANQVAQANTGLANERTRYNAQVPETVFQNQLQQGEALAGQNNAGANVATQQGQQNAGLLGGILGTAGTVIGGMYGGPVGAAAGGAAGNYVGNQASSNNGNAAHGGIIDETCMKSGGLIPGKAKMPGDNTANDTVPIRVSPGEAVVPRTVVQHNPVDVMRLLAGRPTSTPQQGEPMPQAGHDPKDIATLLQAMKHLRGSR
jgi:hypothetical protein